MLIWNKDDFFPALELELTSHSSLRSPSNLNKVKFASVKVLLNKEVKLATTTKALINKVNLRQGQTLKGGLNKVKLLAVKVELAITVKELL